MKSILYSQPKTEATQRPVPMLVKCRELDRCRSQQHPPSLSNPIASLSRINPPPVFPLAALLLTPPPLCTMSAKERR